MASNLRSRRGKNDKSLSSDQKEPSTMVEEDSSATTSNNSDDKVKCAICLGDLVNRSYSNNCRHQFCFGCLVEWSKIKPECPLCKVTFTSIYHNVRAVGDFDVYQVPVISINDTLAHHIHVPTSSMYHLHHLEGEMVALRSHRFHPYGPSSGHLHFPTSYQRDHHEYFRILVPLERRGALEHRNPFRTGQTEYFGTSVNLHNNEASSSSNITNYQSRRRIYDRGQYVTPFGSSLSGAPVNMFPSDEYIRTHSVSISRISSWLHREITVLLGLRMSMDEMANVYDVIMNVLNNYDIRSRDFRELIHSYFGAVTRHFQHELYHFVLSGMRLEEYDRVAVYPPINDGSLHHSSTHHHPTSFSYASSISCPPPIVTIDSDEDGVEDIFTTSSSGAPSNTIENFGNLRSLASSARNMNFASSSANPNVPWDLTIGSHGGDQSRPLTSDDFPALRLQERRQRHERESNQEITEDALEDIIRRVASGDIEELFPDPSISNIIDHQETVGTSDRSRRRAARRGVSSNIQELNDMDQRLEFQMESLRQAKSRLEQRRRETEENIEQIRQRNELLRRIQNSCGRPSSHQLQHPHTSSAHRHAQQQVVASTSEDEECVLLGVHPVTKKPPLAVITISDSSDDEAVAVAGTSQGEQQTTSVNDAGGGHQFKNEVDYNADVIQIPDPFHSFYQSCPLPSNSVTVSTTSTLPHSSRQTRSSMRLEPVTLVLPSSSTSNTMATIPSNSKSHCSPSTSSSRKRKMRATESSVAARARSNHKGRGTSDRRKSHNSSKKKKVHLYFSDDSSVCSIKDDDEEDENATKRDKSKRKRKKGSTKMVIKRKKSKRITHMINSSNSSDDDSDSSKSSFVSSSSSLYHYSDRRGHRGEKSFDTDPTSSTTSSKAKSSSKKKSSKRKKEKKAKSKKSSKSHRNSTTQNHTPRSAVATDCNSRKIDYSSTENSETEDFVHSSGSRMNVDTHRSSNDRKQTRENVGNSQSTDEDSSNFYLPSFLNVENHESSQIDIQMTSDHSNSGIGNLYPTLAATSDLESDDGHSAYKPVLLSSFSQSGNQMSSSSSSDLLENQPPSTDSQLLPQTRHNQDDDPAFLLDLTVARHDDHNFWSS